MLKTLRNFSKNKGGYLLQVFMALLIIGSMGYYLLTEKYQEPMQTQMDTLNDSIAQWTTVSSGD